VGRCARRHRFVKKKVRASQRFKSFHTAERTLEGIEAINMMRKGQVKRLAGSDARGQAKFVESLFGISWLSIRFVSSQP
jgi:IS6 family transposase